MTKPEYTTVVRTVDELRTERRRRHRALFASMPNGAYDSNWDAAREVALPRTIDCTVAEDLVRDRVDELLESEALLGPLLEDQRRRSYDALARFAFQLQSEVRGSGPGRALEFASNDFESIAGDRQLEPVAGSATTPHLLKLTGLLIVADLLADDDQPRPWAPS